MPSSALAALLRPRSIAVIGASTHPKSRGTSVWRSVALSTGLAHLWPVNPKYRFVDDYPCFRDTASLPKGEIDLAILCVRAKHLPRALSALEKNPPKAVLFAPQEEGPIIEREAVDQLLASVKRMGSRLLGPNSLGTMAPGLGINASFWPRMPQAGGIALITQSSMIAAGFLDRAEASGLGFSAVASTGLESDVSQAELIDFFAADRRTRVIALEVQALSNPRAFYSAVRRAADLKPVAVLRAGPGSGFAADRLAASRYGCDAGADDAFDALLSAAGAVRTRSFAEFFAACAALASGTLPSGRRIAILARGSGFAGLAADAAEAAGVRIEGLSNRTIQALAHAHPGERLPVNPVVVSPGAAGKRLAETLSIVLEDPGIDGAAVITPPSPSAPLDPALKELAEAAQKSYKPVFVSWAAASADSTVRRQLASLPDSRLIALRSPEEAVRAFGALAARSAELRERRTPPEAPRGRISGEALARIRLICLRALEAGRHALTPAEVRALIEYLGMTPVPGALAQTPEDALAIAREIGWPVAIKASSPGIGSRSESGLVFLGLASPEALTHAWEALTRNWEARSPLSRPEGVLVEAMSQHAFERELRLGIRLDPVLGPVIEFGGAGLASTLYGDLAVGLPPRTQREAERLAHAPRYAQTLGAYRGLPPICWEKLVEALCRLGDLAAALPALRALRLEPVVPEPDGLLVIDASAALYDAPLMPLRGYPHLSVRPAPAEEREACRARSGEPLTLRAIDLDDYPAFEAFIGSLSSKSFYYRFHARTQLSPERLTALCRPDWSQGGAWGLFDEHQALAASGRWSKIPDSPGEAEFGIAVLDSWHRQGLARILMKKLEDEARAEGFHTMTGFVLPGNEPMERFMEALGYALAPDPADAGAAAMRDARRRTRRL